MKRLTARGTDGNAYFPRCFDKCGGIGCINAKCNEDFMAELCDKLAAYEDTGLEPEEVPTALEMAKMYALLRELKEYRDAEKHGQMSEKDALIEALYAGQERLFEEIRRLRE